MPVVFFFLNPQEIEDEVAEAEAAQAAGAGEDVDAGESVDTGEAAVEGEAGEGAEAAETPELTDETMAELENNEVMDASLSTLL